VPHAGGWLVEDGRLSFEILVACIANNNLRTSL
jgi:hypothetical protein